MVRGRRKLQKLKQTRIQGKSGQPLAISAGPLLLDLHDSLRRAERCRVALLGLGYSREHWQEIVRDVNPELRFVLSPRLLDKIIAYLESVGRPLSRKSLTHSLHLQGAGTLQRIRQSITLNLRSGNLAHFSRLQSGIAHLEGKGINNKDLPGVLREADQVRAMLA